MMVTTAWLIFFDINSRSTKNRVKGIEVAWGGGAGRNNDGQTPEGPGNSLLCMVTVASFYHSFIQLPLILYLKKCNEHFYVLISQNFRVP